MNKTISLLTLSAVLLMSCKNEITCEERDGYTLIQDQGATLGYTPSPTLPIDGYALKALGRDRKGVISDWRV